MATQKKPNSLQKGISNLQTAARIVPLARRAVGSLGEIFDPNDTVSTFDYSPNAQFGSLPEGVPGFDNGVEIPATEQLAPPNLAQDYSSSFGNDNIDFSNIGGYIPPLDSMFDGINFGDGATNIPGSFGNQFDLGTENLELDSLSTTDETGFFDQLSGIAKDIMPWLNAAAYLSDPSKLGNALELGEGNVLGDISQLAGLGSVVGGLGTAVGSSLGGLTSLTPYLGPIGFLATMGSLMFNDGGRSSQEQALSYSDRVFNQNRALFGANGSSPARLFDQVYAAARLRNNGGEYAEAFKTLPKELQALANQFGDYLATSKNVQGQGLALLNMLDPSLINDDDRRAAIRADGLYGNPEEGREIMARYGLNSWGDGEDNRFLYGGASS